jgi:hypothetical protein
MQKAHVKRVSNERLEPLGTGRVYKPEGSEVRETHVTFSPGLA